MKHLLLVLALSTSLAGAAHAEAVAATLKGDLVSLSGKRAKRFDDTTLAGTRHFAIYYSAHWCPPCRAFTPKLVEWYKTTKAAHPDFELIFVSSDNSEKEMEGYMAEASMPWPALDYGKKRSNKSITKYAGSGIPCLVFIDAEGKVLSHSYEGSKYVGPSKVMADIDKILKSSATANADAPAGSAPAAETGAPAAAAKPPLSGATKSPQGSSFDEFFKKKAQ